MNRILIVLVLTLLLIGMGTLSLAADDSIKSLSESGKIEKKVLRAEYLNKTN